MTLRLLDICCGAGGATRGYQRAGFHVTGVDLEPQPSYCGDAFHQADIALAKFWATFEGDFDAIHASPPCQPFSAYRRRGSGVGDRYPDLIAHVRAMLELTGMPYVIENVPGAPLREPVQLCGSSFGLDVMRHRLFEANWPVVAPPCNHAWQTPRFPHATNRYRLRRTVEVGAYRCAKLAPAAMEIDWMTNAEISQALPPEFTYFIGRQLAGYLRAKRTVG